MKIGFPYSISIIFWFFVGILRVLEETFSKPIKIPRGKIKEKKENVAVCIPAHNEEKVILKSIKSVKRSIPAKQIYVVSDGSTDKTASIAKIQKVNVLELNPGKGKANALVALIKKFDLLRKYEFILFVDADTRVDRNYLKRAIKMFMQESRVVVIAAYAIPRWQNIRIQTLSVPNFISAYRTKLYSILQLFLMYGQTWKYTNVNPVIPGFASIYRTKVLKKLRIDTPGIWIEDFNLAFQIHRKKLGRIGHHPSIYAKYQDPQNMLDYWRQVRRWNVGFYQTIRKHGIWPSFFWLNLGYFSLEIILFSLFTIIVPILALLLSVQYYAPIINPEIVEISRFVSTNYITLWEILFVYFIFDYFLTVVVAIHDKKYLLLVYGLGFLFFGFLNSLILISSLPKGLFGKSQGKWTPAKRS